MTVMIHTASSTVLVNVGVLQQVRTCLLQQFVSLSAGLVACMSLCRLPLSRDHQCLKLQCTHEGHHWRAEWQNVMFLDESGFNMFYNDGCIIVRRYTDQLNLRACILQQHRGPMPSVMVWSAIGYNIRFRLLRIQGNLNNIRYFREILSPEILPPPSGNSTCHISAGQCPATPGKDCASLLPKTTGITASLACTFARHVAHRTCQGYSWSATYFPGSSSTYS